MPPPTPEPFWTVRVHRIDIHPGLSGLCVGYERGEWRRDQFVNHVMEWLPEFALKESELQGIDSSTLVRMIRNAANIIYQSEKFNNRGEFGELFLHMAKRQVFNSIPAISKIYYKTARNETVKGFDSVHVVEAEDGLELWIGEVKFYKNIKQAVSDVIQELHDHTQTNYLRDEFNLIINKVDKNWQHYEKIRSLMSPNTSLDEVFKRACIPVLLTYESDAVRQCSACDDHYKELLINEMREAYHLFSSKGLPEDIRIHLFLFPLASKTELVTALDGKLRIWQQL
ncbi:MAG: HamA C-terminal domain-containing protein [Solidesulfovibrio sp. DCME]|uniref:HamA C-terminal domain-containing protein n=1 Tax=Solidesulfovibrio sp. DCME TaxID=3447380 RepID=UPI003D0DE859